ncbi:MAG TPA: hypothetical protein VFP54_06000 [Acidimicrobiales bacterium]|nr:hypothetical protein [Acidimicrobiales bacterium]
MPGSQAPDLVGAAHLAVIHSAEPDPILDELDELLAEASDAQLQDLIDFFDDDDTPADLVLSCALDRSPLARAAAAGSRRLPPEVLSEMSHDRRPIVIEYVADNPATPPEDLRRMAATWQGTGTWLLNNLTRNPSTPEDVIISVIENNRSIEPAYACENPQLTPRVARLLMDHYRTDPDKYWEVPAILRKAPTAPPDVRSEALFAVKQNMARWEQKRRAANRGS